MRDLCRVATIALSIFVSNSPHATTLPASAEPNAHPQQSSERADGNSSAPATEKSEPALAQAEQFVQQGKVNEAQEFLHRYLNEHPASAAAHFLMGYTYFQELHQKAAVPAGGESSEFFRVDGVDPAFTSAKVKASLDEYTAGAKYRTPSAFDLKVVALDYVLLKDYTDADTWLTRSVGANPKDAEAWYYLGRTKYNENRFQEAIAAFQQYLKLDPQSVRGEDNLGLSFQGLGRTREATTAYKTAIAWQKDLLDQDPGPFVNFGALLLDENQPEAAISYLVQAVSISPGYARAHEHLGKAYDRLGQLAKAQTELENAVELAPQNARLHYILGQIYRKEGLTEKAKLEFDRSASLRLNQGTGSSDE